MTTKLPIVRRVRAISGKMLVGVLCLASAPTPVCAQRADAQPAAVPPAAATQSAAAAQVPAVANPVVSDQNAQQTRQQLQELLNDHPPALREVLQRDPALLTNVDYLAPYPRVAAFLASHPEITRSPAYYLGTPALDNVPSQHWMWRELLHSLSILTFFLLGGFGFGWLVRTALDHRRWQRVSKVQVETHSKILDRLTSSDDLRAYIESPAGRQFLESAPIALDAHRHSPLAAPVGRILWSMQVGMVTLLGGIALAFISRSATDDAALPLRVFGVLAIAVGVGFLVSAGLSYGLSRHLGLFRAPELSARQSVPQV